VNKDLRYRVTEVDLVINPVLERNYVEKSQKLHMKGDVDLLTPWLEDARALRTMQELHKDLYGYAKAFHAHAYTHMCVYIYMPGQQRT